MQTDLETERFGGRFTPVIVKLVSVICPCAVVHWALQTENQAPPCRLLITTQDSQACSLPIPFWGAQNELAGAKRNLASC